MKITHLFCYPGSGGSEKYALYLSDEARKSGHEVSFVFGQDGPMVERVRAEKFSFKIIGMPSWYSIKSALALKKYFKENNIEIVHTHFLREHFLAVWAKIFGAKIRIIRTFHRLDQLPLKVRPFYKLFQFKTDAFIAVSEYLKTEMTKEGINSKKITTIYNGTPQIKVNSHGRAMGYLGRLAPEKGIVKFIEKNKTYFQQKDCLSLLIAGSGPEESKIKALINENDLKNIKLMGNISNLTEFFEKISVIVLPSRTEALPLVVLEAYSAAIPVVCFDLLPLRELVPENDRIEKDNYALLLKRALDRAESVPDQGLFNLYFEKFTTKKMWEKTGGLYESL